MKKINWIKSYLTSTKVILQEFTIIIFFLSTIKSILIKISGNFKYKKKQNYLNKFFG